MASSRRWLALTAFVALIAGAGGDTSGSVVHAHRRGQGRARGGRDPLRFRGSPISEPRKLSVQGTDIGSRGSVHHVLIERSGQS